MSTYVRRLANPDWAFRPAVGVLGSLGVALRVLTMVGYSPANVSHPDTASYVDAAAGSLFSDPFRPAGYALFLRALHAVSPDLSFTIVVQHVIGLATAVLAYVIARQLGARRWVALIPAAAITLSGDQLYFEYSLLSDGIFLALVLLACSLALLVPRLGHSTTRQLLLVVAAAAVTAVTTTVRTVGVALIPILILWLLRYGGGGRRHRLSLAAAAIVSLAVVLGYAAAQQQATGVFGLSRFSAWPLYARVAPIADCRRFTPPAHTSVLCETTPLSQRPGPDYYLWNPYSPAERFLGFPPAQAGVVGAFARSTILHEPLLYLGIVIRDLARYIDPSLVTRQQWGADWHEMALNQPWNVSDAWGIPFVVRYYRNVRLHVSQRLMNALEEWRRFFRIHGALIALSVLLLGAGLLLSTDRRTSRGMVLLGGFATMLFVVPTATMSYEARYGVPGALLLLIAGSRGGELALARLRAASRFSFLVDRLIERPAASRVSIWRVGYPRRRRNAYSASEPATSSTQSMRR
jgi:hypothetical protein